MGENDWPVSVLWTREATFPFYQNSGYEPVGPQARGYPLNLSEYEIVPKRGTYDISLYNPRNPDHLDAVMAIHEDEPLRIGRTRDDYEHYFNLHKMSTLLAHENGRIAAYLMLARGRNKPGFVEGGGDAVALEALYHQALVLGTAGDSAYAVAPLNPTSFGDVLEARKPGTSVLDTESDIGFQMMRVNSLSSLISKITGHLRERSAAGVQGTVCIVCVDDGDAVTITLRNGEADVSSERSGAAGRTDAQAANKAHLRAAPGGRPHHRRRGGGRGPGRDLPVLLPGMGTGPLVGGHPLSVSLSRRGERLLPSLTDLSALSCRK